MKNVGLSVLSLTSLAQASLPEFELHENKFCGSPFNRLFQKTHFGAGQLDKCKTKCKEDYTNCGGISWSDNNGGWCQIFEIDACTTLVGIGSQDFYYYNAVTPTASPTISPTASPTISAHADPHMTNVQGTHFTMSAVGRFNLLHLSGAESVLSVAADMASLDSKPCSPTYMRQLFIVVDSDQISFRRGSSSTFTEVPSESFEISLGNQSWYSHDSIGHVQQLESIQVQALPGLECNEFSEMQSCARFEVRSKLADVIVSSGVSPMGSRHFLNLDIARLDSNKTTSASGILWDDDVHTDLHC
jgi:hypothetical protein